MATAPTAGQVVGDLNDPEYINWYKTNRALNITIDVLRPVCLTEIQTFHNSLLRKHTNASCGKPCTHNDIVARSKWGSWSLSCPNKVCSEWLPDIVKARTSKSTRLNWQNSDFSQWQTQPWQLAKVYMDHGQDTACINSADTDAAGIAQLLINFKQFKSIMDTTKVDAVSFFLLVRRIRNDLMHSDNMKVKATDLTTYVQRMVDLLEDPTTLLQDPAAKRAVAEIKLIETTPVEVNDTSFLAQERTVWKTHLASLSADNKERILKLVTSNCELNKRLQNLEGEVKQQVKDVEERLNEKTDEVKQQVKDVEERLNVKTDKMKGRFIIALMFSRCGFHYYTFVN
ncbi:hypothetical protein NP493_2117g00036 [Ridgeia piscesae]|uniref:Uncharacterized protein n=1 Tax=Ridgeia piscesae TaxID=27915 RepID=A0AAD9JKT6_RIDPI|nr:hypothetical protein NP493_2117g00036 [Ridgeia piscesae]